MLKWTKYVEKQRITTRGKPEAWEKGQGKLRIIISVFGH